jgi:hypothetical protein
LGPADIEAMVRSFWGDQTPIAMAIISCEDGTYDPARVSAMNSDGSYDYGIFQLNNIPILTAYENIKYAYEEKYLPAIKQWGDGWHPWISSKHCWGQKVG